MKNKAFFTILLLSLFVQTVWAQNGSKISFKESTYDFGSIKEMAGSVEHKFVFTNTGNAPLIIARVKASCGCTTPAWSREPILPGKTGFIQAKYNPKNRPGSFNKSLTITSNAIPSTQKVYIKGTVAKKAVAITDEYRVKKGSLGFKYSILNLGTVKNNRLTTKSFEIVNLGNTPLSFNGEDKIPSHLKVSVSPKELQAQQKGIITIVYDGKAKNDFGNLYDNVTLGTNDTKEAKKSIRVVANIEEYFPSMSDTELKKAPKLSVSEKTFNFESIKEGDVIKHKFKLTNTGKKPLIIRKTKTSCDCTASRLSKKILAPGESTNMSVTFDSKNRNGKQYKTITIFSNDPMGPVQRISLKGNVLAKK